MYYFHDIDNLIYLSIDENELDDLLIDVRGNKSGIEHLVDSCREVLSIGKTELFENLIGLTNTWSEENNGYPPQLCFVSLFIIAATRMGENSDVIDWRNYYQQVVNLLRLDIKVIHLENFSGETLVIEKIKKDNYFVNFLNGFQKNMEMKKTPLKKIVIRIGMKITNHGSRTKP